MRYNVNTIGYWVATGLLSLLMCFSAGIYLFKNADAVTMFEAVNYPTYIIYPLAIAKIAGIIAIVSNVNRSLKEWAYSAFFFEFLLAFSAHWEVQDNEHMGAIMAIVLLLISYFFWTRLRAENA